MDETTDKVPDDNPAAYVPFAKHGIATLETQLADAQAEVERLKEDLDCGCGISGCGNMRRMCAHCQSVAMQALCDAAEAKAEPEAEREQPCGCVLCICADPVKCHGCGAVVCGGGDECVMGTDRVVFKTSHRDRIRNAAMEEAAKAAEHIYNYGAGTKIAAAIRKLKDGDD